jgi:hypothetical protein
VLKLKTRIRRGDAFSRWDIEVRNGLFARSRCLLTLEEHGMGKQFLKLKCWTIYSVNGIIFPALFFVMAALAAMNEQWIVAVITALAGTALVVNLLLSAARAMNNLYVGIKCLSSETETEKIIEMVTAENNQISLSEKKFIPRKTTSFFGRKLKEGLDLNK